ncbi:LysR family transcriptional regulator [Pseudonocardia nematodicida]|uniref:LysR family transcriptional regulator n=1 Tax=Pseudonocardia nematodicida TaxID=1206997 RepID=A0ABV1KHK0_9PSEU
MANLLPIELVYFREAALCGSINGAAARLRIAGSAVSRQIRKLERSLDAVLLVRHGRGVELTDQGQRLLTHVRRMEVESAALRDDLAGGAREDEQLRVACPTVFATTVMAGVVRELRMRHPRLRLTVISAKAEEATRLVAEERVDVAVTAVTRPTEDVRIEFSAVLPTYGVVGADHPLAGRDQVTIGEMLDEPYALLRGQGSARELLENAARKVGRELRPVLECDQHEALIEFVRLGAGVSFALALGVPDARAEGIALVRLDVPELSQRSMQIQTSPWRQLSRAQLDFLEIMSAVLSAEDESASATTEASDG